MAFYNVLNEVDYHPRKHLPDLNPTFACRKTIMNESLEFIAQEYPMSYRARSWIGSLMAWLDRPLADEGELFAAANEELARLRRARS